MSNSNRLLIVLATYNEIDNLPRLVHQLAELIPNSDILVIDDASPDGTGNWCEQSLDKYSQLSVVHREGKLGLGSAAIHGFRWAATRDYHLIATMDADLSHEPSSLVSMLETIQDPVNHDIGVVIGSRYVAGGATEGWPWYRKLTSRMVNLFTQFALRLKTKDNSGSFRVYRAAALEKLQINNLKSADFAYLEETLWRLSRQGIKMKEYPITFKNRELGRSKATPLLGLRVFWQIAKMGLGLWK